MTLTPPSLEFEALGLPVPLCAQLSQLGFKAPTEIQARTIPPLLDGKDVVGQAQTGTGKTAAFALPFLSHIDTSSRTTQVLVLTPTRELAQQVAAACQSYAEQIPRCAILPIFGGQDYSIQIRGLKKGAHVVVGTPGRVMDHMRKGTLDVSGLSAMVLDEADEMLNMGFIEDVDWIMSQTPDSRQVALFSATMPPAIRKIAAEHLNSPVEIALQSRSCPATTIDQFFCVVPPSLKTDALLRILEGEKTDGVMIFVRTKADTLTLSESLVKAGFHAAALNGDLSQILRERTVNRLKTGSLDILVATDVAARGLDVERISHVINFDAPKDAEIYVHRIGRTGRAGRRGKAILLLSPRDRQTLRRLVGNKKETITPMEIPSAAVLNQTRITRFADDIGKALVDKSNKPYRDIIAKILDANDNYSAFDMAVALAALLKKGNPLLLEELSLPNPNTLDKPSEHLARQKGRRENTPGRSRHNDDNMERFTVQVGSSHGLNPSHLVGAIANEADLSSKFIGRIDIFKAHSTVDLPIGMPEETFQILKKVRVCNRPLKLRRVTPAQMAPKGPPSRIRKNNRQRASI